MLDSLAISTIMASIIATVLTLLVASSYAAPTPLSSTLPSPTASLISGIVPVAISNIAGGGVPNNSLPNTVPTFDGRSGFQLLQFLENLESYY